MLYSDSFKQLVAECFEKNIYIGWGNPSAKILLIGKEGSDESSLDHKLNAEYWESDIKNGVTKSYKSNFPDLSVGSTWRKYQKLHDYIYQSEAKKPGEFDFLERIFTTEMNIQPSKNTNKAVKGNSFMENIAIRKTTFLKTEFIQSFPVIVLACWNYIQNTGEGNEREIDNIFGVTLAAEKYVLSKSGKKKYPFLLHYDSTGKRLVIHCYQLSGAIPNALLEEIGKVIRDHIRKIGMLLQSE